MEIINYIIFGKKEDFTQLPDCAPLTLINGEGNYVQFRPLFFFWDKSDEYFLRLLSKGEEKQKRFWSVKIRRVLERTVRSHIQNKYKEVFLRDAETLFLSERAQKEIPESLFRDKPKKHSEIHLEYAKHETEKLFMNEKVPLTLMLILAEECNFENLLIWLLEIEKTAGPLLRELLIFGQNYQEEACEAVVEEFYDYTGLAGSFYAYTQYKRLQTKMEGKHILLDMCGMKMTELGHPAFYIDGSGGRPEKEIRRLRSAGIACKSLRNHLDRAFLSGV